MVGKFCNFFIKAVQFGILNHLFSKRICRLCNHKTGYALLGDYLPKYFSIKILIDKALYKLFAFCISELYIGGIIGGKK